jgi:very-short-patch-repair endonuclease
VTAPASRKGVRGSACSATRRLKDAIAGDPQFTRGELEARMRRLARKHRLPLPTFNDTVDAPDHPSLEIDCYFPKRRVVVETDGWDTHRTRQAFEEDRAKDAALYTVVRFTWRQLRDDPQTVADRIKAILRPRGPVSPRRARGGPAPA